MADKIANFEDYVNKENKHPDSEAQVEEKPVDVVSESGGVGDAGAVHGSSADEATDGIPKSGGVRDAGAVHGSSEIGAVDDLPRSSEIGAVEDRPKSSEIGTTGRIDPGATQEILQIEIEDPVQFFTEEERQEYYAQRRKEEIDQRIKRKVAEAREAERADRADRGDRAERDDRPGRDGRAERADRGDRADRAERAEAEREEPRRPERPARDERRGADKPAKDDRREKPARQDKPVRDERQERLARDERRRQDFYEEEDSEYDEGFDDEEYQDEDEPSGGVNMDLVVRVASIITGMIILVLIGFVAKVKVYDRYFAPDPDETEQVVVSLPAGYTAKDDTVVVSGASSLNLRTVPSTSSSEYIAATADEGTELKRIAVSEDGSWALVEYNGQQLYGAMKYFKVK